MSLPSYFLTSAWPSGVVTRLMLSLHTSRKILALVVLLAALVPTTALSVELRIEQLNALLIRA